ncbi:HEAT repeat domain-containing protein [candidate division WOR-3 bacterium]|nr:HEAT repeat domain-containing protein [candidate division WOR-3 bacterium]
MKLFKISLVFFLALVLLGNICCKGNNEPEKEQKAVKTSKSVIKVANEFVAAGLNGDFKRLAELCCKDSGPYTSFEDVKNIDLGDVGFIEEIIREEKGEVDPDNLKLAVVRANVLGKIGFYCFYIFKTPAGNKIYLKEDYLWKYPPEKESLSKTALDFYLSNKINLKAAIVLAEYFVSIYPKDLKAHYNLAYIYTLLNQQKKVTAEIKRMIIIDPNSDYTLSFDPKNLILACEELLEDENMQKRIEAVRLLGNISGDIAIPLFEKALQDQEGLVRGNAVISLGKVASDKKIPLLKKALQDSSVSVRGNVFKNIGGIGSVEDILSLLKIAIKDNEPILRMNAVINLGNVIDKRTIPILEIALQDNSIEIKEKASRILTGMGSDKGKDILIVILSDKLKSVTDRGLTLDTMSKQLRRKMNDVVAELKDLRAVKAAPILVDFYLKTRGLGSPARIRWTFEAMGPGAIPALEDAISRRSQYEKYYKEIGWDRYKTSWMWGENPASSPESVYAILKILKKQARNKK